LRRGACVTRLGPWQYAGLGIQTSCVSVATPVPPPPPPPRNAAPRCAPGPQMTQSDTRPRCTALTPRTLRPRTERARRDARRRPATGGQPDASAAGDVDVRRFPIPRRSERLLPAHRARRAAGAAAIPHGCVSFGFSVFSGE
jgi:hypothetical protein